MRLTKFGILVKKTTSFFTSIIRDSKISRGCVKILEIPEGRGGVNFGGPILENSGGRGVHTANTVHGGGGVWIFSGTTHCKLAREPRRNQEAYEAWAPQSQRNKKIK